MTGAEGSILLGNKEKWGCLGGFGWDDATGFQVFLYEFLAGNLFSRIQGVDFGNLGNEVGFQVDDVVVGSVRR